METQTVIFVGPQGSGKGTQAALLERFLERSDSQASILHFETGHGFRQLAERDNYTGQRVKETINAGDLQPTFLASALWTEAFIEHLSADAHIILDGSPRTLPEAKLLDEAIKFYDRKRPVVVHLTASKDTIYERLTGRNRLDDNDPAIAYRLQQYKDKTLPVIDFYRNKNNYIHIEIDGEQPIEVVYERVLSVLRSV